jgi:hypothetical protein
MASSFAIATLGGRGCPVTYRSSPRGTAACRQPTTAGDPVVGALSRRLPSASDGRAGRRCHSTVVLHGVWVGCGSSPRCQQKRPVAAVDRAAAESRHCCHSTDVLQSIRDQGGFATAEPMILTTPHPPIVDRSCAIALGRVLASGRSGQYGMSIGSARVHGFSGAGCRVQGAGCRVQGAGCRVQPGRRWVCGFDEARTGDSVHELSARALLARSAMPAPRFPSSHGERGPEHDQPMILT